MRLEVKDRRTATITTKIEAPDGSMTLEKRGEVSATTLKAFLELFDGTKFWSLPALDQTAPEPIDGSLWLIEAKEEKSYHAVIRHNPTAGPYRELGRFFLKNLAELDDSKFAIPDY